jgi:hypothetical protein
MCSNALPVVARMRRSIVACYNKGSVESERAKLRDEFSHKFISHSTGGHTKLSMFQGAKTILGCSILPKTQQHDEDHRVQLLRQETIPVPYPTVSDTQCAHSFLPAISNLIFFVCGLRISATGLLCSVFCTHSTFE